MSDIGMDFYLRKVRVGRNLVRLGGYWLLPIK